MTAYMANIYLDGHTIPDNLHAFAHCRLSLTLTTRSVSPGFRPD